MQKIAIIGTGISGMGAAYLLRGKYHITFYEKDGRPGGHTHTLTIDERGTPVHIDSAFMVYNETTYPLLTRLFKELDVRTKPTSMSFSVQHVPSGLEFCGTGLNGLFAQRRNIFNLRFVRMLREIERFSKEADEVLEGPRYAGHSLAQYVHEKKYSADFIWKFLVPMGSAVWSTPADTMMDFPAVSLVRFFKNHCFLGLAGHLNWRTCVGGSRQYRDKLLAKTGARMKTDCGVVRVVRTAAGVKVLDETGGEETYDKVLVACHADEALKILEAPTALERRLLGAFGYCHNRVTLHTDTSVMPKTKRAWSSWNYRIQEMGGKPVATTIYDMNSLQGVSQKQPYFISINDPGLVHRKRVLWEALYSHPLYNVAAQQAQQELASLNRGGPVYFSGAYFRYGFHEDGLWSALNAARALSGGKIWE